jgi:diguanylate cyclase (GGDEF)-like protein
MIISSAYLYYESTMKFKYLTKQNLISALISIAIGAGVYTVQLNKNIKELDNNYTQNSQKVVTDINTNFEKYSTVLHGLQAFMITNPNVDHEQFGQYIDSLNMLKNYPGFMALNYASDVSEENKSSVIEQLKKDLAKQYKDNPELLNKINQNIDTNLKNYGPNNEHFIITYQEPMDKNLFSIGKDLGNVPDVYKAIMETKKTGLTHQSGKLFPAYDSNINDKFWAIGVRLPVYDNLNSKDVYLGSVGAAINFNKVIASSINQGYSDFFNKFQVYKLKGDAVEDTLIYDSSLKIASIDALKKINTQIYLKDKNVIKGTFSIQNQLFEIIFFINPSKAYYTNNSIIIVSILTTMLVMTLLVTYFYTLNSRNKAQKLVEEKTKDLKNMAWYDSLTGAYTRGKFVDLLKQKIEKAKNSNIMLFFIDIDNFKRVNDTLGHNSGDKLLKNYVDKLNQQIKYDPQASLSRLGGDEFILMVDGKVNIEKWIELINDTTALPFIIDNYKFSITQSVGISSYPKDGITVEELLRKADIAVYQAKQNGGNNHSIYSDVLGNKLVEENKMETYLLEAIKENELSLAFQPKVKKENGRYKIYAFETLMRWKSKKLGDVPAGVFIPLAEKSGFIEELTDWLINEVCKKIIIWKNEFNIEFPIALNLSAKQFLNKNLAEDILKIINNYNIDHSLITFEITETAIMKNPEYAKEIINKFRENNVHVAMDDFGTGHSSLLYISQFNIDEIKIDKSFVSKITENGKDKAIIESIVDLAHKLDLKVVAEGVEDPEELEYLEKINCDYYQGFYFSTPLKENELFEVFHRGNFFL